MKSVLNRIRELIKNHKAYTVTLGVLVCVFIVGGVIIAERIKNTQIEPIVEVPVIEEPIQEIVLPVEVVEEPVKLEEPMVPVYEGPLSLLSGLPVSAEAATLRPIGIMISNIKVALPQYGVSGADVLYETIVEGGITRLFALFNDFDDEKIGPIRSARHYFLDFALDHDAIYTHFGQSTWATEAFKKLDVDRFYGLGRLDEMLTFKDPNRRAPHSTFTSYDMLMATWEYLDYRREPKDRVNKFSFNEDDTDLVLGEDLTKLVLDYSYYIKPELIYNPEEKVYYRFQFDKPHIDANNSIQLSFKNIIVQYTDIWIIKGDQYGCMDMRLNTKGDGLYITNGKSVPIIWEKVSNDSVTQYYTRDGEILKINPGKTFISVFPSNRIENIIMEESND